VTRKIGGEDNARIFYVPDNKRNNQIGKEIFDSDLAKTINVVDGYLGCEW
jgi:hypothetical protein